MRLLVVCSGNICRSPMAAQYLKNRSEELGLADLVVESGGTLGIENRPASEEAIQTLSDHGLDLSEHRSRGITKATWRACDVVVAMERSHLQILASSFRGGPRERWLLRAFENGSRPGHIAPDLEDPIGEPLDSYRVCFDTIRPCVDHLIAYLKRLREATP